jgi:predicted metal-dependent hydrolase
MSNPIPTKIIRSMRKSLALSILPDKTLVVKAPIFLPQWEIDRFINKNQDWINRKLNSIQTKTLKREYKEGEEFLYQGETIKLKIGDYSRISVTKENLLLPKHMAFRAKKEIENWYIKQAKILITDLTIKYAKEFNTSFKEISFSDTRSKWGSCTHDNRLQFSWRLIMAPLLVTRYVVVHELSHTLEKNHSRNFWARVSSINPSYRQQVKWLKMNGDRLFV